jgi:adenylate cyclase
VVERPPLKPRRRAGPSPLTPRLLGLALTALAWLHILGYWTLPGLDALDRALVDAHIRLAAPAEPDPRIVIVDIDEASLAAVGRWPWSRAQLAALVQELFERQRVSALGFDMVFAEPQAQDDAVFAHALKRGRSVLGYYFTSDRRAHRSGQLPEPVLDAARLAASGLSLLPWDGFGANQPELAQAASAAGFFNAVADPDGRVRRLPVLAEHKGQAYESLALAVFRQTLGQPAVRVGGETDGQTAPNHFLLLEPPGSPGHRARRIPLQRDGTAYVPFRIAAAPESRPFASVSAAALLASRVPAAQLSGKIALVGSTAPGLMDMRATPVGPVVPGVEIHAHMLSAFLDGRALTRPDWASGLEWLLVSTVGLLLTLLLPGQSLLGSVLLTTGVLGGLAALDLALFFQGHWLSPVASAATLALALFLAMVGHGYFRERVALQRLTRLFGTYVPKERVAEMARDGARDDMVAETREMTVLFCDLRGFTSLAETLPPEAVQALLNRVFDRLTAAIQRHQGTVDKYIGDAVMAFWGAPLDDPHHAAHAVAAARDMVDEIRRLNAERAAHAEPPIAIGIGINTGPMCVGDMGSPFRRSYTVIGDAVNIAARLEALTRSYGVDIIASESTRNQTPDIEWLFLGPAQLKGRQASVKLYCPAPAPDSADANRRTPAAAAGSA